MSEKKKSVYDRWSDGEPSLQNLGSFQTSIFKAFNLADIGNRVKLASAFPEWFTVKMTVSEFIQDVLSSHDPDQE